MALWSALVAASSLLPLQPPSHVAPRLAAPPRPAAPSLVASSNRPRLRGRRATARSARSARSAYAAVVAFDDDGEEQVFGDDQSFGSAQGTVYGSAYGSASRSEPGSAEAHWLAEDVLALPLVESSEGFADRLRRLCLDLESLGAGEDKSNEGGFHSEDLTRDAYPESYPVLRELADALHAPLAAYLWGGSQERRPPRGADSDGSLCIRAVFEKAWANVNRPGQRNMRHDHGKPSASVVASGIIYPSASSAALRLFHASAAQPLEVLPRPCLVVLFPTDLAHETHAVPPEEPERLSLAFNLHARWLDAPLLRAAAAGDAALIAALVAEGADVEHVDAVLGFSALHLAAEAGHIEAMDALLAAGANDSAFSAEGWSPLGLAYERGQRGVAEKLAGSWRGAAAKLQKEVGRPPPRGAQVFLDAFMQGSLGDVEDYVFEGGVGEGVFL